MIAKSQNIAVLIDCDKKEASHWFELFNHIKKHLRIDIQFIVWSNQLADIARSIVDIDTVHLIPRSLFKLSGYKEINLLLRQYDISKCVEIGHIPKFVDWKIKNNNFINVIKVVTESQKLDKSGYSLIVYPNYTAKINHHKKIAYTPFPQINYKDFLDLNTQIVLDLKQNLGLISYENQVINKSFVCGHIGKLSAEFITYLEYNNCEWYDISTKQGSFVLKEDLSNNLPIVYELLDCLIVSGDIDQSVIHYHILNAIASGTIVVAPREDQYQELLGRGALYYSPNSSSELAACIDVIQKNENKKLTIREQASEQFQRKYSYQAIAQFWSHLLAKI